MHPLDLARRHYGTTSAFLELLESGDREGVVSGGNWELYVRIADGETAFLPKDLEREARSLLAEWDALAERCERQAYLGADHVIEKRFPWKGGVDLHENLHKLIPPEEMGRCGAGCMGLPISPSEEGAIASDALRRIAEGVVGIYTRKKNLEQRMIAYLSSPLF